MDNHFEKVSFEQFLYDVTSSYSCPGNLWLKKEEEIREIYDAIQLPRRATSGSAGYDFYLPFPCQFIQSHSVLIPTGIRVSIQPGQFLMCVPRSGLGFKYGMRLKNTTGVIDSDYCFAKNEGHIMAKIDCDTSFSLEAGDRFMQGIFVPYFITADDNPIDNTRTGGFGSTGGA